jgi:hypothetical protein
MLLSPLYLERGRERKRRIHAPSSAESFQITNPVDTHRF